MRILLDHNVNPRFARVIEDHDVCHAHKMGWAELGNGELIAAAESAGFGALITADKNLLYQQNLKERQISILVLNSRLITWPNIEPLAPQVNAILRELPPGSFHVITPELPGRS